MKEGYDVYAIVPVGRYIDELKSEGIKVINYYLKRESLNPIREAKTLWQLYRIFKNYRFDIIHTFTIKPNIYGSIIGKLVGIPIIICHVTGLGYIHTLNNLRARLLRILSNLLQMVSFKIANKIIFQNSDDFNKLSFLLDKYKALIIKGTGVDINYFSLNNTDLERVKIIKNDMGLNNKLIITFIARLYMSKGIKELIEAANTLNKKFKDIIFLIIGWIDKGNPDAISEKFIEESKSSFIKFIGKRQDIREILYVTDIYTLPSYREGLPRTILEAMSMEKPVITTKVPGCRETVIDGINGLLVSAKDSKSLAGAIEKLISDKELREKMGKAGREKVIKEFSNEIITGKILKLYEELSL